VDNVVIYCGIVMVLGKSGVYFMGFLMVNFGLIYKLIKVLVMYFIGFLMIYLGVNGDLIEFID